MCGIFGAIASEGREIPSTVIRDLASWNSERGDLGFGAFIINKGQRMLGHWSEPFNATRFSVAGARVALFHTRAPTHGQTNAWQCLHPFEGRTTLLAHNGLLLNHAEFAGYNGWRPWQVDSMAIQALIEEGIKAQSDTPKAIKAACEMLKGQQACWLWDKRDGNVYLWRVMSPLHVGIHDGILYFSSVSHPAVASQSLVEGYVYRIPRTDGIGLEIAGDFEYETPYADV
jgi:glucosamine 6-phosphate synthetase-like amidotransferase/phosphosugar isomerase protein